jgi:chemotaxis response regulator CheB
MLLRRVLEKHSDWQVCGETVNGVEAIEQIEKVAPDLAILDLGIRKFPATLSRHWSWSGRLLLLTFRE